MTDVSQELKDAENTLRDFIAFILEEKLGEGWVESVVADPGQLAAWKARKEQEAERDGGRVLDERLIYYAHFENLIPILERYWPHFEGALGDWGTMKVWLAELKKLRDPTAHGRELLPHQKSLAAGIAGEIRTRITRYRSSLDSADSYFPRIEMARDSLGNVIVSGQKRGSMTTLVRVGAVVDYVVTATDPLGKPLEYAAYQWLPPAGMRWSRENTVRFRFTSEHVRRASSVDVAARRIGDEAAVATAGFMYSVLPKR